MISFFWMLIDFFCIEGLVCLFHRINSDYLIRVLIII